MDSAFIPFVPFIAIAVLSLFDKDQQSQTLSIANLPIIHEKTQATNNYEYLLSLQQQKIISAEQFWHILSMSAELSVKKMSTLPACDVLKLRIALKDAWYSQVSAEEKNKLNAIIPGFEKCIIGKLATPEIPIFRSHVWKQIHAHEEMLNNPHPTRMETNNIGAHVFEDIQHTLAIKNNIQALLLIDQLAEQSIYNRKAKL